MNRSFRVLVAIVTMLSAVGCQGGSPSLAPSVTPSVTTDPEAAADELRMVETDRVAALVAGNVDAAKLFFSEDYWLIDPAGEIWARDDYLSAIGSGGLDYVAWDVESDVSVRVSGDSAIIRYRASIELAGGDPSTDLWHTDYYERVDGRWQVVWSQATEIVQ